MSWIIDCPQNLSCPQSFASRPTVYFMNNLSVADIIPSNIGQPPEGVYLLNMYILCAT